MSRLIIKLAALPLVGLILLNALSTHASTYLMEATFTHPALTEDGFVTTSQIEGECIYFNLESTSVTWRVALDADKKGLYSLYDGGELGIVVWCSTDSSIRFLARDTGRSQARFDLKDRYPVGTVRSGVVVYGHSNHIFSCLDKRGEAVWDIELDIPERHHAELSLLGGYVFACIQDGLYAPQKSCMLVCIDADSGKELWRRVIDLNKEPSSVNMSLYQLQDAYICVDIWRTTLLIDFATGKVLQSYTRKQVPVNEYTAGVGLKMAHRLEDIVMWNDKLVMSFIDKYNMQEKTIRARIEVAEMADLSKRTVYVLEDVASSRWAAVVGDKLCLGAARIDLNSGEVASNETEAYRKHKYQMSNGVMTKARDGIHYFAATHLDDQGRKHRLIVAHRLGTSETKVLLDELMSPKETEQPSDRK